MSFRILVIAICIGSAGGAWAFPELTRYGYNQCIACHVSPSGGGLLTSYGRNLSAEVLSHWGDEKDAGPLWSAASREKIEEWLLVGGDVRAIQAYVDSKQATQAEFIKMQGELELGVIREKWGVSATIGEFEDQGWNSNSRRFYGLLHPRDELTFRAGRFLPNYGLNLPDHVSFVRSNLGLGLDGIRDNAELQWTAESWSATYTFSKQFKVDEKENAHVVQAQWNVLDNLKLAVNGWLGKTNEIKRQMTGAWMIWGISKKLFLLSEIDLQTQESSGNKTQSLVSYNKFGYTPIKGVDLVWVSEHLHTDVKDHSTITNRNGPGVQIYPYPHFELSGLWAKQESTSSNVGVMDYAWLLLHYYF